MRQRTCTANQKESHPKRSKPMKNIFLSLATAATFALTLGANTGSNAGNTYIAP